MNRTINIFIGENPTYVGKLYFNAHRSKESAAFEYDLSWLNNSERFSLDPLLPLVSGPQYPLKEKGASPFHHIIADTEPDGWGRRVILRDHAKQKSAIKNKETSRNPLTALDFLLSVDDMSRVGALRFQDENKIFQRATTKGQRTTSPIIELVHLAKASRAIETNTETTSDLKFLRGKGTSLGGLRPKCTIIDESGQLSIGKFPSVQDERPVTKGEVLSMQLARLAGIQVPDTQLVESEGISVALIRRFDRVPGGGRIPYASAATMLGVRAEDEDVHTYTEIVDILRMKGANPQADIEELWRRIAFSILITNVDDHLRNHGFLHSSGELWRLSPAFDLNPFPDRMRELKTWISEDTGPDATIDALMSIIAYFQIKKEKSKSILREVEYAVSQWRKIGKKLGFKKEELDQFAEAFEHEEREKTQKLLI